jgi:iron complex transport system substrate-binding protein
MNVEEISSIVVDTAFNLQQELGPGLLESVYEAVLAHKLREHGLTVERQKPIAFTYQGIVFDEGFRVDLMVNDSLIIELKSVEKLAAVHFKQLLTYLRLLNLPLGLLINFGGTTFKEGVRRIVNDHSNIAGSRLRINSGEDDIASRGDTKNAKGRVL